MANSRNRRKDGGSRSGSKLLTIILLVAITLLHVKSVASTSRFHRHLPDVTHSDIESSPVGTPRFKVYPSQRTLAQVGVGTVGLDFLASVESFPDPDAKIRTLDALAQGGGNVGNALTAAARLGLRPRIFSKLPNDSAGIGICKELESNGVDVSHIVVQVAEAGVSPFTYVIVDKETWGLSFCFYFTVVASDAQVLTGLTILAT